ncbi:helix-turn-helix transcriptional regulator [Staphylococcus aureus]|uniref:helix-turn-helix domain-containing protein n=1 Tax=Staphylococcus aureus TaxID=1280 RepID=UPI00202F07ED|nr:helix-turn-helix transcriptional regulator [Staphylococcus aureus]MCM0451621.1 helix-turn-helix transcriptional regulator [Staphylococcus aureus]MCM0456811.1 helix-turn-helix transcriptional regulator [Staphylococcus aureus]MCM0461973.1 helix-turn-helix transcriptional regulator [Staphylococcus aureus]MCM0469819.1 helix-turn-helix transcriptional regulator [Staphylococcus aureus]MCM0474970.1 helix-turn-helix transcriptional regulator [Staphylococcus aureus]
MIRNRLSELLSERGLKISRVAKDVKIARSSLTSMIQNDSEMIRYDAIDKLCRYLSISVNDFFEYVPINIDLTIENIKKLTAFNNGEDLQDLSKVLVYVYIDADFLVDIEFNNKDYDFDCELSLSKINYNNFFNEFIFVINDEDKHSDLKEKIDNLTPGLKKLLYKRIKKLLAETFINNLLDNADEEISFPEFSSHDKNEIQEAIKNSKFVIKSNIFTEY